MTHSPHPDQEPEPSERRRPRLALRRAGFVASAVVLAGGIAGAWWAWLFIHEELAPIIERNLSQTLNRPVNLGAVEGVTLRGLRFGQSAVPPTETDPDRLTVEAVEVEFNLLELLLTRTLRLNVELIQPDIYIQQAADNTWVATRIEPSDETGPISTDLNEIRVREGRLVLAPYQAEANPLVTFEELYGRALFQNNNQQISFNLASVPLSGGRLRLSGRSDLASDATVLRVRGRDILATDVDLLVPLPLNLQAGRLNTNLEVHFPADDEPLSLYGTTQFRQAIAQLPNVPNLFTEARGRLRFDQQRIFLQNVRANFGEIPFQTNGSVHTQEGYDLTAQVPSVSAESLLNTFDIEAPVPVAGDFRAALQLTGEIDEPNISGSAQAIRATQVDRLVFSTAQTEFSLVPGTLSFNQIRLVPQEGGLVTGNGQIALGETGGVVFDFQGQNLPGDAIAARYDAASEQFTVGTVNATAQVFGPTGNLQTLVQFQAPQATYPVAGQVGIVGDTIRFQDTIFQVAGGTIAARGDVIDGRLQAVLNATGVQLAQFSEELRGALDGTLNLTGTVGNLQPAALRAEGQVRLSEGVALIERPITASIAWLGDRLQVRQATAPGVDASGFLAVQLEGAAAPAITALDLNVQLRDFTLAELPIPIPEQVPARGRVDFTGQVTGTPEAPSIIGAVQLQDLVVRQFTFDPVLTGNVRSIPGQGLDLDLAGPEDRIQLALDAQNRPTAFLVQHDQIFASGEGEGGFLTAELRNFPIEVLGFAPAADFGLGGARGLLNANVNLDLRDLDNPAGSAQVAIANPALGFIAGEQFIGQVQFAGGAIAVREGELLLGESRFLIAANVQPGETAPVVQGQLVAEPGRIQDLLTALQIFDFGDFADVLTPPTFDSAIAIEPTPVGLPQATLLNQLRRYSEIRALLDQQIAAREEASPFPDLSNLQGEFAGDINFNFGAEAGLELAFNLSGENWIWEDYQVNEVIAEGSLEGGVLTLLPLSLQSEESLLTFSGQVGGEQQSGQLRAENVPVAAIRDFFEVPLDVDGNLNATATLAGSVGNPQVLGEILLTDATLSNEPVQTASTVFGFADARLNFDSQFLVGGSADPLLATGSIPYTFPFMTAEPDSDAISLDVAVEDEGLALINLLTDQIAWRGGSGQVNLTVRGTLSEPLATGTASFDNAVFASQVLPEPLTNVTGTVLFDADRILVERLQGEFSDGAIVATGIIPIFAPLSNGSPDRANALTVALTDLEMNLKGLYNGGVDGQLVVLGSLLAPQLSGDVLLSQGRVSLPDGATPALPGVVASPPADGATPLQFDNLRLRLGQNLLVTRDPILNFVVTGDLVVNGTLDDLRPDGTVRLRSGQVNLFTSQFNLARGYPNIVVFAPDDGVDPFIDVRLIASVLEVTRTPIRATTPFASAEVADLPPSAEFGEIQTVRVQATVTGPASEALENIELTSSPGRSDAEIVALLGGGFIDTLGQDPTLAIAGLAGSALLTRVQNLVANTLGLSEFRLFPTTIAAGEDRAATFGLAAEVGVDVTNNISVSLLQLLTADVPTRYSVRYRLTNEFLLRGSSDFSGDSRGVLEYRTNF